MADSSDDLSPLIERYRTLLKKDASPRALDETLALVQDIAMLRIAVPTESEPAAARRDDYFPVRDLEFVEPKLKQFRSNRSKLRLNPKSRELIYQVLAALALPGFFQRVGSSLPSARISLLFDATQVLFHQTYFVFVAEPESLPTGARNIVLEVLLNYADQLPASADRFRTAALVHHAMRDPKTAEFFARMALRETSPAAHEYLTVLQTAWSGYIDNERFGLAMLLLVEELNNGRIVSSNFDEFLELAETTLEMLRDAKASAASIA